MSRPRAALCSCAALLVSTAVASAGSDVESWLFDVETTGADVVWMSPTAIDPTADAYDVTFTFQMIEVDVSFLGIPVTGVDVTDQVPPDLLTVQQTLVGPMPHVLADDDVIAPAPPEPTSVAFHLVVAFDADGFGIAELTNVVLGTATVDLGFPLGVQTVNITRVHAVGQYDVETLPLCALTDLDGSGTVGFTDLNAMLGAWGACPEPCPPDIDGDGSVGFSDLNALLSTWGGC